MRLTVAVPRLFIAVWPPPDVIDAVAALRREDEVGVRHLPPETWHVTLRFFGEADTDEVAAALDAVTLPTATARLGPRVGVIARSAIAIPVRGLDALAGDVCLHTPAIGQPARAGFRGHLTIARLKTTRVRSALRGMPIDAEFAVEEISLVRSHLGQRGARYETITSWKVGPRC